MDIREVIALTLLIGRALSVVCLGFVLRKQLQLRSKKASAKIVKTRNVLFTITFIVFLGNIVPIILDASALIQVRSFLLGVLYAYSNNLTMLLSSIGWVILYYRIVRTPNNPGVTRNGRPKSRTKPNK